MEQGGGGYIMGGVVGGPRLETRAWKSAEDLWGKQNPPLARWVT